MAHVNNATGLYGTLGYNFDDPNGDVIDLSANTQAFLNTTPAFIQSWQAQDIINNDVGGYFENPVAANVNTIITYSGNLVTIANGVMNLESIVATASSLYSESTTFLAHTNRVSGVTPFQGDNSVPYYQTAVGMGKSVLYITNQTDGIINNSPILGSMTSILVGPQIGANAAIVVADTALVQGSIYLAPITDEMGNTVYVQASNLTPTQIAQVNSDLTKAYNLLHNRRTGDYTFFQNTKNFIDKYNVVKSFSNIGETESYLLNNFVGTEKIKTRINS